jgi:uncharacterized protein YegL
MGAAVKKTMIYVLLDESGSMGSLRADVIGGINEFIDDQRKSPDPAVISIAAFGTHIDKDIRLVRPMVDLKEVQKLTEVDFVPNGGTPLLDAMGRSMLALDEDWKREKPDRCVFVSFTDGEENSSKEYTKTKIAALKASREKSGLWLFLFMGANIDSFHEAGAMGYARAATANFVATPKGFRAAVKKMSETTYSARGFSDAVYGAAAAGNVDLGLGGDIGEDGSVSINPGGASVTVTPGSSALPPDPTLSPVLDSRMKINQPPAAAMVAESWTPPTSSALFDSKLETWKVPT